MSFTQEECSKMIFFVQLVEKNPCLWNHTMKSYSRADVTSLAWKNIATEMKETEQICRDRWKNIRTAFGRSLKPLKSGSGRLKKPYYLAPHLSFLHPYMKGAPSSGNVSPLEENEDNMAASNATLTTTDHQEMESCEISEEMCDLVDCDVVLQSTPPKRKAEASNSDAHKVYADWLEVKQFNEMKRNWASSAGDADWMFFQSILPDFKKLNDRCRRDLKAKFLLLLNEQLDEAENDTS
ncbi:uncharacterized protein LOC124777673 [Schistocerca piceifrons]|uniref:uncharacterized protein LOC124777673 n=1 Tax=Schistocerca piceifrons TaxID=274613 RepID=UPI001F5F3F50|nr:uncharacterized protein LOC124777673 [Schistocerca piceifrons]